MSFPLIAIVVAVVLIVVLNYWLGPQESYVSEADVAAVRRVAPQLSPETVRADLARPGGSVANTLDRFLSGQLGSTGEQSADSTAASTAAAASAQQTHPLDPDYAHKKAQLIRENRKKFLMKHP